MDFEALLSPISADAPCGEDLSEEQVFFELVQDPGTGTEAVYNGSDLMTAAEDPDWTALKRGCLKISEQTRDLNVQYNLTRALMNLEGLPGLCDGLQLIRSTVEQYWDTVHPQLDPDDDNDPIMRINIIEQFNDPAEFTTRLQHLPLCKTRANSYSLQSILKAKNPHLAGSDDASGPSYDQVVNAFLNANQEETDTILKAATEATEHATEIQDLFGRLTENGERVSLEGMISVLRQIVSNLSEISLSTVMGSEAPTEAGEGGGDAAGTGGTRPAAGGPAFSGELSTRGDVIEAMKRIEKYFARYEPTSPVPLLIARARRMVTMNFIEIIQEMAEGAMHDIETIVGRPPEEEEGDY